MAEHSADRGGGLLDLEKELTCSICTDILYQPLTLLDCLHTFCGGCVKEWFAWQAASVVNSNKRTTGSPYTCPSCRESVRGTKADWRLTALLEGFLKANPDKGKSDEDKEEMRRHYKPGDDIIPPVEVTRADEDSEDERLMADIMGLSMANVDPETARRRTERATRERQRRRQERDQSHRPEELSRRQQSSRWVAQQAEIRQQEAERQVEHQPSLRSLLSNSDISSEDVQQEILQSIYSEGLLNGIDIDNLTPAQEEELTERIAEAYRRRQRHRDRSRNRERDEAAAPAQSRRANSPRAHIAHQQQPQARPRPPIARPHLFEQQATAGAERHHRRSASSTGQNREGRRQDPSDNATAAARSATDLSAVPADRAAAEAQRPRALSSNARSTTDPARMRDDVRRVRATSNSLRPAALEPTHPPRTRDARSAEPTRRQTGPSTPETATVLPLAEQSVLSANAVPQQEVRPAVSAAALAPEPVTSEIIPASNQGLSSGSVTCSNCHKADIGLQLHYNCSKCDSGTFNLCLDCYREGKGCHHWFGFGLVAIYRWQKAAEVANDPRSVDYPHLLMPRKFIASTDSAPTTSVSSVDRILQEGAFCESCLSYSNDCYWYCNHCLEGAWGYCNACVLKGRHCTHPLLAIAHISTLRNSDPSRIPLCLPVPHLKQDSYVLLPVLTDCDICRQPINLRETRFHCYQCSAGDYDICNECYHSLVAIGKISSANGPNGWRRCLQGHRMAVVGYQDTPTPAGPGKVRVTMREMVGGWRLKDDVAERQNDRRAVPAESSGETSAVAVWSRWPKADEKDELHFPKNAELRENEDLNPDWSVAVYAGKVGLVPKNYTRKL
ncbi:Putative Zinc finger, ZZ-type, SH3 domain, Zinc finger, RING-type, Zinc finger, RING/FYVE/PHD-type [Septoria linicola]|uniref:Zinc finger, ZZ-type, SH3 domain, Zinc finger, RING-type, Zinc finger, RING/FYVE/PHD-type n=1 Tax=Septoria linicola TaxID=215465 RepID=A0A9Q9APD8_9PEZI|nr:putative Zinc finger, ZZ-type, SH3 domain, Zinc finger, RING-type, Zinc finger, RING/FYVE/PHD-type [Septoria linicola]USW51984.1 Putative Zinc finger, ZZ-type, SH3 domain, Zinc finger, RING-type, Zinc finger, RING/FYVE/PHD-type [Septoria linicola]